ncbi:2-polyprenyl-6-methoxyphenol hydroxylase-like oxidoreductase [Mycolicibacterium chubuense NBB4]|uniref:2-polyprenyl-6-methoxyphenol hydroxylase-like oxidoreductase n=1 Tax=Mycolicibacterium chubuense (strain NBB4) TaxID=710421 RepID=I4BD09_MYCCN|nr:FAD-dependent oxidoreductase [Mycolicibacterium chubuense]AFM15166.1 2-polyprenyl-6-methoxyphenol hydroxylase-like oxidoreductase [Mycolicibacterium chubuense NBB4]
MDAKTTCVIAGGGPAGMVLGLLLARAGVDVTVCEKHADFLRDFRGDTVHPTTLRLIDELGLWPRFRALPQSRLRKATFDVAPGHPVTMVDFERLRQPHPYVAMVPQWDLLNLLAEAGEAEPTFTLRMSTEVTGLLRDGDRVTGVHYVDADGPGELRADLTVGCDGRWSLVRRHAGLQVREWPVSFDVWWFRLPRRQDDAMYTLFPRLAPGKAMIVIPREGYLQIALLIPKGSDARLRARGLAAFHADVTELLPEAGDTVEAVTSLDDVKHLDVRLNRLHRWHVDGLLCIGDAAHAMSPAGGVGINVAVQDGVATARLLAGPLRRGRVTDRDLAAVRRRRVVPTAVTQALQRQIDKQLLGPILRGADVAGPPPWLIRLLELMPWLAVIPGYLVGVGVRPERAPAFARQR